MRKVKIADTSRDAFKSLKADEVRAIYQKIVGALEKLGSASSEQIADFLTIEHARIHKRTSEMEGLNIIFRPGHKVPTKSGRNAYVWQLCSGGAKTDKEKALEGDSVADYSRKLIKKESTNPIYTPQTLF